MLKALSSMLNSMRESPWVRTGLLVVVIAFCGYGLYVEWPQAQVALARLHWYSVAGAALAAAAGAGCFMLAWRALLADLGSRLPLHAAIRVMFVAQLAKYLPGAVWAFAAQVELGNDYQVPRRRNATSVVTALAVTLGTALLVAAVALPLTSATAARHYWWAITMTPLILIGLYPPVLGRLIDKALTLIRQPHLEQRPSARGLAAALAWTSLGWLFWGLQAWLLVRDMTGLGAHVLLLSLGAYALAWSAGILIVVFPGGIGPRELALIAALAPVAPRGTALVIALVSRVVMTASDLAWGGAGIVIGRLTKRASRGRQPAPAQAAQVEDVDQAALPARPAQAAQVARPAQVPTPDELGADIQIT
jgi:glycosyltransferase 2 family protein